MTTCIGVPVSYLRLERYELRELPAHEHQSIADHLAQCPTCRACYERMHADDRKEALPALIAGLQQQPPAAARPRGWLWGTGALALCLIGLLAVLRGTPGTQPMAPGAATKGAALALELTRVDADGHQRDPSRFAPGDRWKVAVSCPPALAGVVRVLAFQAGERFEPLPAQTLASCGNRRMLTGAFRLDGLAPVDLCVLLGDADITVHAPDALPEPHVCTRIEPVANDR